MPGNVNINFPEDYNPSRLLPIQLGRIYIGGYVARLFFSPDGEIRLSIDKKAVEEGYLLLVDDPSAVDYSMENKSIEQPKTY